MANKSSSGGVSGVTLVFIIFLILKLTGNIDWSWWWVTSPLWIPVVLGFAFLMIVLFVLVLLMIFGFSANDLKNRFDKFRN